MMNSKEALKELSMMINREKHINSDWNKKIDKLKNIIQQDIDRLEKLEKAIKIINDALELYVADDEIGVENRSSFIKYEDNELLKEVLGYESCNI